ncbi:MAG: hypothetical protein WD491_00065 [Balneolales bacterium]
MKQLYTLIILLLLFLPILSVGQSVNLGNMPDNEPNTRFLTDVFDGNIVRSAYLAV